MTLYQPDNQVSTVHLWMKIFLFEGSGPHQKFQDPTKTLGDGREWGPPLCPDLLEPYIFYAQPVEI